MPGMMWGMGFFWLLVVIVLILAAAAQIKYLLSGEQGRPVMSKFVVIALAAIALSSPAVAESGDIARGQRDFRACAPCHSLEADRNMTGPSLAGLWGRKAGSAAELRALLRCAQILRHHLG